MDSLLEKKNLFFLELPIMILSLLQPYNGVFKDHSLLNTICLFSTRVFNLVHSIFNFYGILLQRKCLVCS